MEITINEKKITLKKTFRSLIAYESATGKAFNPKTVTDSIMYFYCVIISSALDLDLSFDNYLDWLDENPDTLKEFTEWLVMQNEIDSKLTKKKSEKKVTKTPKK